RAIGRSAPKSGDHDTGDELNLKFPKAGSRRPCWFWRLLAAQGRYDRWLRLGLRLMPQLSLRPNRPSAPMRGPFSGLVRRFVAVDLKMLNRQRPVMRRHLLVVLPGDRIGR